MYKVIEQESGGKVMAFNRATHARGLCQLTFQALKHLEYSHPEFRKMFYRYVNVPGVGIQIALNRHALYSVDKNIQAGCAFMRVCEDMARTHYDRIPWTLRLTITRERLSVLYYMWGVGNVGEMLTAFDYMVKI
jgi:hypothetical protein